MNTINTIISSAKYYLYNILSFKRMVLGLPWQSSGKESALPLFGPWWGNQDPAFCVVWPKTNGGGDLWYIISNKYEIIYYLCVSSLG